MFYFFCGQFYKEVLKFSVEGNAQLTKSSRLNTANRGYNKN